MKQGVSNWKSFQANEAYDPMGEVFTLPSLAVPGMTLSMRDLIDRYVRGHDVQVFSGGYDEDDVYPPGIENLPEQDKIELARQAAADVTHLRDKIQSKRFKDMRAMSGPQHSVTDDPTTKPDSPA